MDITKGTMMKEAEERVAELDDVEEPIYFDDCHMNDQGYEIMANEMYEKILPLIINDLGMKK